MTKRYVFTHLRPDKTESGYVDKMDNRLRDNDHATSVAIQYAKKAASDGLTGFLQCKGLWDAAGWDILDDIGSVKDPYAELPEDTNLYEGYEVVYEVFDYLWPWEAPHKIDQPLKFNVSHGIEVCCFRPRGNLIEMFMGEKKVESYHGGPYLRTMMLEFGLSEVECREIWAEVLAKLAEIKAAN